MNAKIEVIKIVDVEKGVPKTTTLQIALGLGIQHKSIIQLVRSYKSDFDEFDPLAFEMRMGAPLPQGGYGHSLQYAVLNEQHEPYRVCRRLFYLS